MQCLICELLDVLLIGGALTCNDTLSFKEGVGHHGAALILRFNPWPHLGDPLPGEQIARETQGTNCSAVQSNHCRGHK